MRLLGSKARSSVLIGVSAIVAILALTMASVAAPFFRGLARSARGSTYTPLSALYSRSKSFLAPISSKLPSSASTRFFSNTTRKMAASDAFLDTIAARRSIYALKKESPISDARINEILEKIIKEVPSSFNSQTTRVVLLANGEHDKLWDLHAEVLKPIVPEAGWAATEAKLNMFKGAYATVRPPTIVLSALNPY